METINIKFDEEQLEEVVKKVTEKLKETKPNFYELSDTSHGKKSVMYLEANVSHYASEEKKVYFGHLFDTFDKTFASGFYSYVPIDHKKVEELKSQGWKEEVVYK